MTSSRVFGPRTAAAAYLLTLLVFACIDFVWLASTSETLYKPVLKDILLDGFRPAPAIVFYLLYIIGLVWFAVRPALLAGRLDYAIGNGALFGCVAYGTYDLTNQATLKAWSTTLTVADMVWGSILSAVAATLATAILGAILRRSNR